MAEGGVEIVAIVVDALVVEVVRRAQIEQEEWLTLHGFDPKSLTRMAMKFEDLKVEVAPLHWACYLGDLGMCRALFESIGTIDTQASNGSNAIMFACEKGHLSVCKWLFEVGAAADITKADNDGFTPMYIACEKGHLSVCKWLSEVGAAADRHKANKNGVTPMQAARRDERLRELHEFLLDLDEQEQAAADEAMAALLLEDEAAETKSKKKGKGKKKNKQKAKKVADEGGGGSVAASEANTTAASGGSSLLCARCDERKPLSEFSKTQRKKAKQQSGRGAQCTSCLNSANDARAAEHEAARNVEAEASQKPTLADMVQRHKLRPSCSPFPAPINDDDCGYCGRWWCPLTMQCRHCHKVRYCDEKCMLAHWRAGGHADFCEAMTTGDTTPLTATSPLPPDELRCPITLDLFTDPVTAADGVAYERSAIERYFRDRTATLEAWQRKLNLGRRRGKGAAATLKEGERVQLVMLLASGFSSPMGHGVLTSAKLVSNHDLARRAAEWGCKIEEKEK